MLLEEALHPNRGKKVGKNSSDCHAAKMVSCIIQQLILVRDMGPKINEKKITILKEDILFTGSGKYSLHPYLKKIEKLLIILLKELHINLSGKFISDIILVETFAW